MRISIYTAMKGLSCQTYEALSMVKSFNKRAKACTSVAQNAARQLTQDALY